MDTSNDDEKWSFPSIHSLEQEQQKTEASGDELLKNELIYNKKNEELEILKTEFQNKVSYLQKIISKIENEIINFDNDIIKIAEKIIKAISMSVIKSEIKLNPSILVKMINELSVLMKENNGFSIYLSKEDYHQLKNLNLPPERLLIMDQKLACGDVVLKSRESSVWASLEKRINNMIGIEDG